MLLYEWLNHHADATPGKLAACFASAAPPHDRVTYGELRERADRAAAALVSRGVGPGDRVAMIYDNSLPALVWFWAVLKCGASTVDVPTLAGHDTIRGILEEARPKAVAIEPKLLVKLTAGDQPVMLPDLVVSALGEGVTDDIQRELDARRAVILELIEDAPSTSVAIEPHLSEHAPALIVYTSGTTGRPQGVMLSHANFRANLEAGNAVMGLGGDDSILVVVPLYYIHGRMQLLWHTMIGGTLVFSAGFQFPQNVLKELHRFETTGFSGVPYHFKQLMDRSKIAESPPPRLRYVLITGGALSPDELDRLARCIPSTGIHLAYGQTEASPRITYIGPDELFEKRGSVGRALPNVKLEILGGDGTPVPAEAIGEVVAGGPNIMLGYVSGDHRTSGRVDEQGRLRTGDLGRLDDDGHLFLVGRSSEMIKSAGERIFPQEIESVLVKHPDVEAAAVVGVPDASVGERLIAYVQLHTGRSVESSALKHHCLQSLPFVRVPKQFVFLEALPQTGSGKVNRGALRDLARSSATSEPG